MFGLGVEILTQLAGEGGRQGVGSLGVDLLHYLIVRFPPEIFQIFRWVLHQPEQVGGQIPGCLEITGGYVGVSWEALGVVATSIHHRYCPALQFMFLIHSGIFTISNNP